MTDTSFETLLAELRPKLHRYCARMTGSVIDGEDVLQDAYVKALAAWPPAGAIAQPERWLFRIAHNAALDFLRRRARLDAGRTDEDPEAMSDANDEQPDPELVSTSLRQFMRLPRVQRSSVILMDVLGYTLSEIGEIVEASVPAVKSALHRGRTRLHAMAKEPEEAQAPALTPHEQAQLVRYVDRFNAGDYDALRAMLAEEARLDLVNRHQIAGRANVERYFTNYAQAQRRRFELGFVDGRAALLAYEPPASTEVSYFILLEWDGEQLAVIRDFLYARYALDGATIAPMRR